MFRLYNIQTFPISNNYRALLIWTTAIAENIPTQVVMPAYRYYSVDEWDRRWIQQMNIFHKFQAHSWYFSNIKIMSQLTVFLWVFVNIGKNTHFQTFNKLYIIVNIEFLFSMRFYISLKKLIKNPAFPKELNIIDSSHHTIWVKNVYRFSWRSKIYRYLASQVTISNLKNKDLSISAPTFGYFLQEKGIRLFLSNIL